MIKETIKRIVESIKHNLITYCALIIIVVSILKGLEFLALISLILIWVRNDPKMGIRLREIFVKIGKEGVEFRPPEETVTEERTAPDILSEEESRDYRLFREANNLLSQDIPFDAEKKYMEIIQQGTDQDVITDSYLNLGVVYMRLWHQTNNQVYLDKSIEASRTALERAPEGYRSRLNLAVALSKNKLTEPEALRYFQEADVRGDLRDPLTWGKVKLFKGSLIATLSGRPDGKAYEDSLPDAELAVLEALRLFEMVKYLPETAWLINEAKSLLNLLSKKKTVVSVAETVKGEDVVDVKKEDANTD